MGAKCFAVGRNDVRLRRWVKRGQYGAFCLANYGELRRIRKIIVVFVNVASLDQFIDFHIKV